MGKTKEANLYEIVKLVEKQISKGTVNIAEIKPYLNEQINLKVVPENEAIATKEQKATYVYYVISGRYFHYRILKRGSVNFLSIENAPQWIGIDKVIDPEHANVTGDKVLKTCIVLEIRAGYFISCIEENGEFARYIIKNLLTKMAKISVKSDRLMFSDAKEHLMFYILDYWDRNHKGAGSCKIDIKNEYIAEEIGVTLRTLYRILNKLKEEGLIVVTDREKYVNSEQIDRIRHYFS